MGGDHRGSHLVVTQDPLTPTLSRQGRGKQVEPYEREIASLRLQ